MLNISKQIYAAWNSTATKCVGSLYEAVVIPAGNTSSEKNKLAKLTKSYSTITEFENVPLPGFTLHCVDRVRYGSDQTWLVIDPRGFIVRITSQNLQEILTITGITEGLIQQKCVWVRDNAKTTMSLMPVTSKIYNEALAGTELIESKVAMSDVKLGDEVLLQSKLRGKYMGVLSLYRSVQTDYRERGVFKVNSSLRRQVIEISPGKYHFLTDLKILQVINRAAEELTYEDVVNKMNSDILQGTAYFSSSDNMSSFARAQYYGNDAVKFVSKAAKTEVNLSLEEIQKTEVESLFPSMVSEKDSGVIVIENSQGKKYLIQIPWYSNNTVPTSDNFKALEIAEMGSNKIVVPAELLKFSIYDTHVSKTYSLNNFVKFYKIVKHVKDDTYI